MLFLVQYQSFIGGILWECLSFMRLYSYTRWVRLGFVFFGISLKLRSPLFCNVLRILSRLSGFFTYFNTYSSNLCSHYDLEDYVVTSTWSCSFTWIELSVQSTQTNIGITRSYARIYIYTYILIYNIYIYINICILYRCIHTYLSMAIDEAWVCMTSSKTWFFRMNSGVFVRSLSQNGCDLFPK